MLRVQADGCNNGRPIFCDYMQSRFKGLVSGIIADTARLKDAEDSKEHFVG